MKQKRSPKKPNVYFTQETENAIVMYNTMEDEFQKNVENNWFKSNFYWVEINIYNKLRYENLWN